MTAKRFDWDLNGIWDYQSDSDEYLESSKEICELLNKLHEENDVLKQELKTKAVVNRQYEELQTFKKENEQLKQDNNALIHLLENQSIIIQELHSKLLEYQVKEPIVLTEEDLELMGKAISYYTHRRYGE